jgi:hypothetical protein
MLSLLRREEDASKGLATIPEEAHEDSKYEVEREDPADDEDDEKDATRRVVMPDVSARRPRARPKAKGTNKVSLEDL